MRVIEEISFPECKASIFYMNQKYIAKFEQGNLEQSYKIGEIDYIIKGIEDIRVIVKESLYPNTISLFKHQADSLANAMKDY